MVFLKELKKFLYFSTWTFFWRLAQKIDLNLQIIYIFSCSGTVPTGTPISLLALCGLTAVLGCERSLPFWKVLAVWGTGQGFNCQWKHHGVWAIPSLSKEWEGLFLWVCIVSFFASTIKGRFLCFTSKEFSSFLSDTKKPFPRYKPKKGPWASYEARQRKQKHRITIRQNDFCSYSSYGARVDLSALSGPAPPTRYKDLIQFSSPLYRSKNRLSIGQKWGVTKSLHLS